MGYIVQVVTLSLTIRVYLHSFNSCWLPNLRNPAKFRENLNFAKSSKVIDLGGNMRLINND